jgi:hypothetical protein
VRGMVKGLLKVGERNNMVGQGRQSEIARGNQGCLSLLQ